MANIGISSAQAGVMEPCTLHAMAKVKVRGKWEEGDAQGLLCPRINRDASEAAQWVNDGRKHPDQSPLWAALPAWVVGAEVLSSQESHFAVEISTPLLPLGNPSVWLVTAQEHLCLFALWEEKKRCNKKIKHYRQSPLSCAQQLLLLSAGVKKHVPFESI